MSQDKPILDAILQSQQRTDEQIGKLVESVQKLVVLDAARAERDKNQVAVNKKFGAFMDDSRKLLDRLENLLATWDKVKIPLITMLMVSVLAATGYNLKG